MKTSEKVSCLCYDRIDVLIPIREDCPLFDTEEVQQFNLDSAMASLFNLEILHEELKPISGCRTDSIQVVSSRSPEDMEIPFSEIKILNGATGEFLASKGIAGFRFFNGKLQYLLELENFYENTKNTLCASFEYILNSLDAAQTALDETGADS